MKVAPDLADAHLVLINVLLDQGRFDKVIQSCDEALARVAPSPTLYLYRGLGRAGRRDFAGAIDDYTRALALKPDWAEVLGHRGWSYVLSDAPALALRDFDKLVGLSPDGAEGYAGRGASRVGLGLTREGIDDVEEAVRRSGGSRRMLYIAAQTYAKASAAAAADAARRGRLASRDSLAHEARAAVLLRQTLELTPAADRVEFWQKVVARDDALKPVLRNLRLVKQLQAVVLLSP